MKNTSSFDITLTRATLAFTVFASGLVLYDLIGTLDLHVPSWHWVEAAAFLSVIGFLIYGNVGYQLTRLGHLLRLSAHAPASRKALDAIYDQPAPALTFLVPSYKEEVRIVRQTLLSAALQEFPNRRVVLLIDDPYRFSDPEALAALVTMRHLASDLNEELRQIAIPFIAAQVDFQARCSGAGVDLCAEAGRLAVLYNQAATVFDAFSRTLPVNDHTDAFFDMHMLQAPAKAHQDRAHYWENLQQAESPSPTQAEVACEYKRLAALFKVDLCSFERKRYANLSHEPNKAMNLNSYIGLLGKSYREDVLEDAIHLNAVPAPLASLTIPAADYLITLDADSLLLPDYALRLIHLMMAEGNERIAVAQTPYSAIPGASSLLERIAGATTDMQYLVHQGFTHHRATFWVGANAVLRYAALQDIAETSDENGHLIRRYIQDRTVIEDTESTVDLIDKGWTLYNYPERLAYSATPPDFGSLAVQRGRWANGGLIILPKLLRYLLAGPNSLQKAREAFFRIHYLTSIAGVNIGLVLLLAYPFPDKFQSVWLPLTALPYYFLYFRDLRQAGYRKLGDIVRVYALNLLLLPVNVGGVLRSLHQGWKGHRIPFVRTPKVAGRTCVPARYVAAEFAIIAVCLGAAAWNATQGHWGHASFAFLNGLLFSYAVHAFVGFRYSFDDLCLGLKVRRDQNKLQKVAS